MSRQRMHALTVFSIVLIVQGLYTHLLRKGTHFAADKGFTLIVYSLQTDIRGLVPNVNSLFRIVA